MPEQLREKAGWGVKPRLIIPFDVWRKLMAYCLLCPAEINGFGMVERQDHDFVVEDIFITRQTVTAGSAVVDIQDTHRLLYELTARGVDTGRMRLQWHSHVDMPVFFSITDTNNIEGYGDWMVSLVVNKRGEFKCRLDIFNPFRFSGPIDVTILLPQISDEMLETCQTDIEELVRIPGWFWLKPGYHIRSADVPPPPGSALLGSTHLEGLHDSTS